MSTRSADLPQPHMSVDCRSVINPKTVPKAVNLEESSSSAPLVHRGCQWGVDMGDILLCTLTCRGSRRRFESREHCPPHQSRAFQCCLGHLQEPELLFRGQQPAPSLLFDTSGMLLSSHHRPRAHSGAIVTPLRCTILVIWGASSTRSSSAHVTQPRLLVFLVHRHLQQLMYCNCGHSLSLSIRSVPPLHTDRKEAPCSSTC